MRLLCKAKPETMCAMFDVLAPIVLLHGVATRFKPTVSQDNLHVAPTEFAADSSLQD